MSMDSYVKLNSIGRGNYGEAWLVRNKYDRKKYVLKSIDLRFADEKERIGARQEAELLSRLKHPNIVAYKESFNAPDGYLCIAMGYCEGGDLYHRLRQQNGVLLPERQVGEWFVQISMAIKYMHDRRILHRDLKTQNIFLTKSEIIKVGDFGIARVLENSNALATTMIGTPYYMSPELFSNKPYDYKSDVWALGCCVYEVMTLNHAFDAKSLDALAFRIIQGKLPPMPGKYSPGLLNLVKMMLQKDQKKRPSIDRILGDTYIREQIREFLKNTKKQSTDGGATQQTHSTLSLSSQSDNTTITKTKYKENSSKNVEMTVTLDLEKIDEEEGAVGIATESAIQTEKLPDAAQKGDEQQEIRNSADKIDDKKKHAVAKLSEEKVKPADTSTTAEDMGPESKRDRRRKKKRAELHGHIAKPEKKSNKNFGKGDETQAPVDHKFRHLTAAGDDDDDKPTVNECAKGENQKNSDRESKQNGPSPSDQNKVVESVQFIGNRVFYHREVAANEEIDQGITINIQSDISSQGQTNGQINGFQEENSGKVKSPLEKGNGDATIDFKNNDNKKISSSKHYLDNSKLRSSRNTPLLKSDYNLKLRSTGIPKMKSKAKIARKPDNETVRCVSSLNFEPVVDQANSTSSDTQDKAEEVNGQTSKDIVLKTNQSPVFKRPLPPRPGHSAVEPTQSQVCDKLPPIISQLQSNGSSSLSSQASSVNSSKDDNMEASWNVNSSSRQRRRKMKETEQSYVMKSIDNGVLTSSDEQNFSRKMDGNKMDANDGKESVDYVDGNFHRKDRLKVSRSLDNVMNALVSEFCSEDKGSYVSYTPPRDSFSFLRNDMIPVVDDLESSSSSSMEEEQILRGHRYKEIKDFISILSSTLLIGEEKSVEAEQNESEVDSIVHESQNCSENDATLFVRRPLPVLRDSNEKFRGKTDDKPNFYHDDAYEVTGRLFERITALRTDCLRGLGHRKLDAALKLIENFEAEETEPKMIKLLGYEDFAKYAGKIWQLKYCMEHAFSSRHK